MLYVGGIGTIAGPILGAVMVNLLPETFRGLKDYQDLVYGAGLILLLIYAPKGLAGARQPRCRAGARHELLSLQGVTRRFGGLVAVDAIDLEVTGGHYCRDRPEWRGQNHAVQHDLWISYAECWPHFLRRRGYYRPFARSDCSAGSFGPFNWCSCFKI